MSDDIQVRTATPADAFRFMGLYRDQDDALCREKIGLPADKLAFGLIAVSPVAFAVYWRGEPAVLFGVSTNATCSGEGVPWLMRTPVADMHPLSMAKVARRYLPALCAPFETLRDRPEVKDVVVRRWLSWLGFSEVREEFGRVLMQRQGGRYGTS
jgi:hypothetical protein